MALAVITFIEGWIDTPAEPIPEPSAGDENNENKEEADDEGIVFFDVKSTAVLDLKKDL